MSSEIVKKIKIDFYFLGWCVFHKYCLRVKMSVVSSTASGVERKKSYICDACSYTTDLKSNFVVHMKAETHIKNAYNKLVHDRAMDQFKAKMKEMEMKINKMEDERDTALEMNDTLQTKIDESASELIKIKNELADVKNENESLKNDIKESECDDKSETSSGTPYTPNIINNYSPEHEKVRHLFENLFGIKPIRYVPSGSGAFSEFQLLRSGFQNAFNTWKIYPLHVTSSNINPRITIGVPTLAVQKDSVVPFVFYVKYHVYIKGGTLCADCLCSWDGKKEVVMIKY